MVRFKFTDEKYFSLEDLSYRHNERVYIVNLQEAEKQGGIHQKAKHPKTIMVCLGASRNGLTSPVMLEPGEILSHKNYIECCSFTWTIRS
ncbi:unnamed protein product [Rotaria sp. Silwood2]|nr:unnamed protein product [Rotaria sp. Silwood2]CAF3018557.1 unnamed protein product [Rotaria sp. Silwood2]CAF3299394.1 unnamed protein product [Rotaria sp. Silwood2]CAF4280295.1 unnamed protein product [Rotaria sp. Silwood2]CAF4285570.1 unnamed protein product [Rotaria sp. Silwood2]